MAFEIPFADEQVRDRHDRVTVRREDASHLANGDDRIVDEVEGLTAQHDGEGTVSKRKRDRRDDVRPAEMAIEIHAPHGMPRDQLGVGLRTAEQVEDRPVEVGERAQRRR
jgi:hypothetical protein